MEITAISVERKDKKFDLFTSLQGFDYKNGDVLVVSSKFVSMSEGMGMAL